MSDEHDYAMPFNLPGTDPERARAILKRAFVDARCDRCLAAKLLRCTRSTWWLWSQTLGLLEWQEKVEMLAKEQGWYRDNLGGWPTHRTPRRPTKRRGRWGRPPREP